MNKFSLFYPGILFVGIVNAQKPNVVFILADDLGIGDISAFNAESQIYTPNIDALAKDGVIFTDAHSSSALSTPSRYSILTGRYPWRTTLKQGVLNGYSPAMITPDRKTLGDLFQSHGYNTACIGKWHLGLGWKKNGNEVDFSQPISDGPIDRGFDYFYGIAASLDMPPYVYIENNKVISLPNKKMMPRKGIEMIHGGEAANDFKPEECLNNIVNSSIRYINEQKKSAKPFFLYLPLTAPHTPILPSKEYIGKTSIGAYGDFVVMIDDMVKKIRETLENSGLLDNTIIVFASDNGCAPYIGIKKMKEQGHYPSYIYRGYKSDIYEGGHRIPLIISWKGKLKKDKNNSLVSLTDFYATFSEMLNHKLSDNEAVDSYSLWPIIRKEKQSVRKNIIYESGNGFLSIRTETMKLVFHGGSGGWGFPNKQKDLEKRPPMQLFNIKKDFSEKVNLINIKKFKNEINEMTETMIKYIEEGRSTPGQKVKNDTKNNWKQIEFFMK